MPFFLSSRRRQTRWPRDWSSDVCSSDLQFKIRLCEPKKGNQKGHVERSVEFIRRKVFSSKYTFSNLKEAEIGRASCRERSYISFAIFLIAVYNLYLAMTNGDEGLIALCT